MAIIWPLFGSGNLSSLNFCIASNFWQFIASFIPNLMLSWLKNVFTVMIQTKAFRNCWLGWGRIAPWCLAPLFYLSSVKPQAFYLFQACIMSIMVCSKVDSDIYTKIICSQTQIQNDKPKTQQWRSLAQKNPLTMQNITFVSGIYPFSVSFHIGFYGNKSVCHHIRYKSLQIVNLQSELKYSTCIWNVATVA